MHTPLPSHCSVANQRNSQLKSFKMKAVLCLFSIAAVCLLTFSLSSAVPVGTTTTLPLEESTTVDSRPAVGYINGSKLVITNVVKTLEFEVALEEDDNSTETSIASTGFIETDIKIINPALLEAVVAAQASISTEAPKPAKDSSSQESDEDD